MKKIITILILSFIVISCNNSSATNKIKKENIKLAKERDSKIKMGGAKMKFEKTEHDFGTINEGDIVETIFKFTNSGKSELIITSAKATCGCTVPQWPKEPIMPGESGEIKVKFNSKRKPNLQQKRVTLITNTDGGKEFITIKAMVTPKKKDNLK